MIVNRLCSIRKCRAGESGEVSDNTYLLGKIWVCSGLTDHSMLCCTNLADHWELTIRSVVKGPENDASPWLGFPLQHQHHINRKARNVYMNFLVDIYFEISAYFSQVSIIDKKNINWIKLCLITITRRLPYTVVSNRIN